MQLAGKAERFFGADWQRMPLSSTCPLEIVGDRFRASTKSTTPGCVYRSIVEWRASVRATVMSRRVALTHETWSGAQATNKNTAQK